MENPKITLGSILFALLAFLTVLQGGVAALSFPEPWNILAPLLLTGLVAALSRLLGQSQGTAENDRLQAELDQLKRENVILREAERNARVPVTRSRPAQSPAVDL